MKYLKLGEKATMFFDPASRIQIRGTEVVALKAVQKTKKVAQALSGGHLAWATEEEYQKFLEIKGKGKDFKKPENRLEDKSPGMGDDSSKVGNTSDPLELMDDEEFEKHVKESGFDERDQKAILKAKNRVKKFHEIESHYE